MMLHTLTPPDTLGPAWPVIILAAWAIYWIYRIIEKASEKR